VLVAVLDVVVRVVEVADLLEVVDPDEVDPVVRTKVTTE
jgi:hypothetical protein